MEMRVVTVRPTFSGTSEANPVSKKGFCSSFSAEEDRRCLNSLEEFRVFPELKFLEKTIKNGQLGQIRCIGKYTPGTELIAATSTRDRGHMELCLGEISFVGPVIWDVEAW